MDRTSDLDVLIPEAEQLARLEGGEDLVDARAVDDPRMRAAGRDTCAALELHPLGPAAVSSPSSTSTGHSCVPGSPR